MQVFPFSPILYPLLHFNKKKFLLYTSEFGGISLSLKHTVESINLYCFVISISLQSPQLLPLKTKMEVSQVLIQTPSGNNLYLLSPQLFTEEHSLPPVSRI